MNIVHVYYSTIVTVYILVVIRCTAICVDVVVVLVDWFTGGVWCGADCTHYAAALTMLSSACGVVFKSKFEFWYRTVSCGGQGPPVTAS